MNKKIDNILTAWLMLLLTIVGALTVVFVIAMCNTVGSVENTQSKVDTVYVNINYEED